MMVKLLSGSLNMVMMEPDLVHSEGQELRESHGIRDASLPSIILNVHWCHCFVPVDQIIWRIPHGINGDTVCPQNIWEHLPPQLLLGLGHFGKHGQEVTVAAFHYHISPRVILGGCAQLDLL